MYKIKPIQKLRKIWSCKNVEVTSLFCNVNENQSEDASESIEPNSTATIFDQLQSLLIHFSINMGKLGH